MSWLNNLFGSKGSFFRLQGGNYNIDVSGEISASLELAYKRNCAIVSAIINKHTKDIAEIEFGPKIGDEIIPVEESQDYAKYNLDRLAGKLAGDLDLDGNIYLEQIGAGVYRRIKPSQVSWISRREITVSRGYDKQSTYIYNIIKERFEANQNGITAVLYHANLLDTIDNETGRGESPLLAVQNEILMNIYANVHNSTYLKKGMKSDMLIMLETNLSDDNFQAFKKDFLGKHAGAENAGAPMILSGAKGVVKDMQGQNKDMDFKGLLDRADSSIALIYDVPLPIIDKNTQTYNNYAEAEINYYKKSVLPLMRFVVKFLNEVLEAKFVINVSSIPALQKEMIENSKNMSSAGIYSVNESREIGGYGEIEGGDQIFRPSSDIPIGDDGGIEEDGE